MASPSLRDDFAATVELYSTFINQLKAESPQLNVSEVSFARGKAGKNSYGKRHSTEISNVSNANVDDRLFEKHEYNALTPDQKNTLRLKRLKRGHVGKSHTGAGNDCIGVMLLGPMVISQGDSHVGIFHVPKVILRQISGRKIL
jgi:hypothetical protein